MGNKTLEHTMDEMATGRHGHFLAKLAEAWMLADSGNRARIETAFADKIHATLGMISKTHFEIRINNEHNVLCHAARVHVYSDRLDKSIDHLLFNFTDEGLIIDAIAHKRGLVLCTDSMMYDEITDRLMP